MSKIRLSLALLCLALCSAFAAEAESLNAAEKAALVAEANALQNAVKRGDASAVIAKTHPSVLKIFGTQEQFETVTRQAMKQMADMGVVMESIGIGVPTEALKVGDEQVCFVPTTMVLAIQGQRAKAIGFLVAARKQPKGEWRFVDSAGLRAQPDMLNKLFPEMPKDVKLPPVSMEKL